MEDPPVLNLEKICRTCLSECEDMYSIFSQVFESENCNEPEEPLIRITEILMSISSIQVRTQDGLPSQICPKCIELANISFKFQKQCNQAQQILDAYAKPSENLKNDPNLNEICEENDLSSLEQINRNYLMLNTEVDNPLDPTDFLLIEDEILGIKNLKEDLATEESKESPELTKGYKLRVSKSLYESSLPKTEPEITDSDKDDEGDSSDVKTEMKSQENGDKVFACKVCERSYKHSNSLRVHMRNHTQENPYECKTCGKKFKQCGSLVYHMRSHTGERPYSCKSCGKKYRQSGSLTAHMRIHTGARPFLCSICGRGFRQAADLGYHMRCHTKEKPYMCNICGKTMSMQSHLVQHMRIHTGERPYKCKTCEKAFPSSTRLKRHEIIHSGLKPYTCDVCSKSFNRRSSLNVHAKIHTDERSFVCQICNKGFIQAHALKSHLVSHSSKLLLKCNNKEDEFSI